MNSRTGASTLWTIGLVCVLSFALLISAPSPSVSAYQASISDCDGDGIPDDMDPDDDNDGVLDYLDPARCDASIPGETVPDYNSSINDNDDDGLPDDLDPDDNNNGITDQEEPVPTSTLTAASNANPTPIASVPVVGALPTTGSGASASETWLLSASLLVATGLAAIVVHRKR